MTDLTYAEARQLGKTSLSELIANKITSGEGISKSFSSSIGEKFSARRTRLKEKFDPLNIVKFLTGGSNIGPALLGRMLGRSVEDISHFAGGKSTGTEKSKTYEKAQQRITLAPFYTKLGPGAPIILKNGDSVADIVSKIYRLMKSKYDRETIKEKKALMGLAAATGSDDMIKMMESFTSKFPSSVGEGEGIGAGSGEFSGGIWPLVAAGLLGAGKIGKGIFKFAKSLFNRKTKVPKSPKIGSVTEPTTKLESEKVPPKEEKVKPTSPTKTKSEKETAKRVKKFKSSQLTDKKGKPLRGAALNARLNKLEKGKSSARKSNKTVERFKNVLGTLKSIDGKIPDSIKKLLGKVIGGASVVAKVWPIASAAIDLEKALAQYNIDKNEDVLRKEGSRILGEMVGGFLSSNLAAFLGSRLGQGFGGVVGGVLGSVFPPAIPALAAGGAATGAVLGDLAGAWFGGEYGSKAGGWVGEQLYEHPEVLDAIGIPKLEVSQGLIDNAASISQNIENAGTAASQWGTMIADDYDDVKTAIVSGAAKTGETLSRAYNSFMDTQDQLDEFQNGSASLNRTNNNVVSNQAQSDTTTPGSPAVRNSILNNTTQGNYRNSVVK